MRVLFINSVCGVGSTGLLVEQLAAQYRAAGHEVRIAYGRSAAPERVGAISDRIGTALGVRFHALAARLGDCEGFTARHQTRAFLRRAECYDPHVLWLHNLHGYYLNLPLLFAWIKSRPHMEVRWTLHDCWAFTGHCAHFSYVHCDRWRTQCAHCPQTRTYPSAWFVDRSAENFRRKKALFCGVPNMTLITPSQWLADLVKASFLGEYPVRVVRNEIDTTVFRPTPSDLRGRLAREDQKIVLGVAAVWTQRKGFSDYLRLSALLGEGYRVVLVGLTARQARTLPPEMLALPRVERRSELAAIYCAADVFVNLTYEDTAPTVNAEAMACGTPCLTYRTGGSAECVPVENTVAQGDLHAIAALIRRVCAERD